MVTHELIALDSYFRDGSGICSASHIEKGARSQSEPGLYAAYPAPTVIRIVILGIGADGSEEEEADDLGELHVCGWRNT
jgi:hypothetical protein